MSVLTYRSLNCGAPIKVTCRCTLQLMLTKADSSASSYSTDILSHHNRQTNGHSLFPALIYGTNCLPTGFGAARCASSKNQFTSFDLVQFSLVLIVISFCTLRPIALVLDSWVATFVLQTRPCAHVFIT